jgi:signal transduction histidine kinase
MRTQVELAGGSFQVDSTPSHGGTTITAEIHLGTQPLMSR